MPPPVRKPMPEENRSSAAHSLQHKHSPARGRVGAGDIKLFAVLGYYFGAGYILTAVFLTVLTAALYSVAALLMKKTTLKQELPFAPFALAGTVLTIMLGV